MYKIEGTTIILTRGDTFKAQINIKKDGATYSPQDGDVVTFTAKKTYSSPDIAIQKVVPNDTLLLEFAPSDTENLKLGDYVYDIDIVFATGEKDTFIPEAKLILRPEV